MPCPEPKKTAQSSPSNCGFQVDLIPLNDEPLFRLISSNAVSAYCGVGRQITIENRN
jgi:hypothetical protein